MNRKAMVIGIDRYEQTPLHGCCRDAEAMRELLARNGDGSSNFSVRLEKNVPTKADLRMLVQECFSGDTDVALFYYSGHGYMDAVGGYLVTPDVRDHDYGVSLQELLTVVNDSKCRDKIIILDSCHAGFMGSVNTNGQNTAVINEGVTILTAGRVAEPARESDGHGLFTALLLEALAGGAADITGYITPGGIYAYIDKALGPWSQRPVFKTNVTRFISLRSVKPQVDPAVIRRLCDYFPEENHALPLNPSFEPTNSPGTVHEIMKPYADPANTQIFADLQKLEGIGLVVPDGEEHMYFAAMKSKSCRLTSIGKQYWRLVHENLI